MPRPKGLPKTGGRQKGTGNRVTGPAARARRVVAEAISGSVLADVSPLEYMLAVLRDPTVDERRRDTMAMAAAPYIHAKLAMTAISAEVRQAPKVLDKEAIEAHRERAVAIIRKAFEPLTIEHEDHPRPLMPPPTLVR
jgi:hypothetical protein